MDAGNGHRPPSLARAGELVHYLRNQYQVGGWLSVEDILVFITLDEWLRSDGVGGDILEIGVFHGRSAILLGFFCSPGEKMVVCDLFGQPADVESNVQENEAWYTGLTEDAFSKNYKRFHPVRPDIHACSSVLLPSRLQGTFRLIHVDGAHDYDLVLQDLQLAIERLVPGGIIIADDYRTFHAPGVAAAVWQLVGQHRLRPLLATQTKFFATTSPVTDEARTRLQALLEGRQFRLDSSRVGSDVLLRVHIPPGTSVTYQA